MKQIILLSAIALAVAFPPDHNRGTAAMLHQAVAERIEAAFDAEGLRPEPAVEIVIMPAYDTDGPTGT